MSTKEVNGTLLLVPKWTDCMSHEFELRTEAYRLGSGIKAALWTTIENTGLQLTLIANSRPGGGDFAALERKVNDSQRAVRGRSRSPRRKGGNRKPKALPAPSQPLKRTTTEEPPPGQRPSEKPRLKKGKSKGSGSSGGKDFTALMNAGTEIRKKFFANDDSICNKYQRNTCTDDKCGRRHIEDNTQSWVRNSHGSNKFVMDSNNNDTQVPEDQLEEQALQPKVKDFTYRSKAKAKPQRRETADYSPRIIPMYKRNWIDIEPGNYSLSLSAYEVSKKVIHLLRHSQKVQREDDGAVHFWRIKQHLQSQFESMESMLGSRRRSKKGDISTALMIQEQLFISELFKDIQDAILLKKVLICWVISLQRNFCFDFTENN